MSGDRGAARGTPAQPRGHGGSQRRGHGPPSQPRGHGPRQVGTSWGEEEEYGPHTPDTIPPTPPRTVDPHVSYRNIVAPGNPSSSGNQAQLQEMFRHFLNNYEKKGGVSLYQLMAEIQARQGLGRTVLELDFNHLLKDKQYVDLAIGITGEASKNPEHSWLQPIARDFLNTWFNLEGDMKQLLGFCFLNEAKSVKPLSAYKTSDLLKKQSVYGGEHQVWKISHKGRHVYLAVLNYTLAVHRSRKAWNGNFSMADIYIVEYNRPKMECLIYANTKDLNENDYDEKVSDLKMVNALLTPKYQVGVDGYPPYLVDLKAALEQLTRSTLSDTGFVLSLPFHLALMPPAARFFLLSNLHLVTQVRSRQGGVDFSSIIDKKVRRDGPDWRPEYKYSSDRVLKGVYNHNNRGEDKFSKNVKGMFDYKRNLVHHAHQHLPPGVQVIHRDESELFAASKVPLILPIIVNKLFSGRSMKFEKELGSVWSDYCNMCYNDDEDNVSIRSREMPSVFLQ